MDVAIVGAGLAGASVAWALARSGRCRRIVVVETEHAAGQHASSQNAAMIRQIEEDSALQALAAEGAARLRAQPADWQDQVPFRWVGSLLVARGPAWARIQQSARHARSAGVRSEVLTTAQAQTRLPLLRGADIDGAVWSADDGVADVHALLRTLLDAAIRRGTELRLDEPARALSIRGDRVVGVVTSKATIEADVVVNAAGAWAAQVGAWAGVELPLRPLRRHLYVSAPLPGVPVTQPLVWDVGRGAYFRPESGGLLLCACDESDAEPGVPAVDPALDDHLASHLTDCFPALAQIGLRRRWAGLRTFAPDRRFVLGADRLGLVWAAGLGGHAVTTCTAVGRLVAEAIVQGVAIPADLDVSRLL